MTTQNPQQLPILVKSLADALLRSQSTLSCAESCTGGWIAKVCTDLAGSSAWFDAGFVTYSNAAKQAMLGVSAQALQQHGAVSEAVVMEMAQGALQRSQANLSVAVSGIAGPGGGSDDKPVGTVWLAWADASGCQAQRMLFSGDRDAVRHQTVVTALQGLLQRASA